MIEHFIIIRNVIRLAEPETWVPSTLDLTDFCITLLLIHVKGVYYLSEFLKCLVARLYCEKGEICNLISTCNEKPSPFLIDDLLLSLNKWFFVEEHFTQESLFVHLFCLHNQNQISKDINITKFLIISIKGLELEFPLPGALQDVFELCFHFDHFFHELLIFECLISFLNNLMIGLNSFGQGMIIRMIFSQLFLVVS